MSNLTIEDLKSGESWACKFRTTTFVDDEGNPVTARLNPGEAHPGSPKQYESVGVIEVRDLDKRLVQLVDIESNQKFVVGFDDCWDLDTVEWVDD